MDSLKKKKVGFWMFNVPFSISITIILGFIISFLISVIACYLFANGTNVPYVAHCIDSFPAPGLIVLIPVLIGSVIFSISRLMKKYREMVADTTEEKTSNYISKLIIGVILCAFIIVLIIYAGLAILELSG